MNKTSFWAYATGIGVGLVIASANDHGWFSAHVGLRLILVAIPAVFYLRADWRFQKTWRAAQRCVFIVGPAVRNLTERTSTREAIYLQRGQHDVIEVRRVQEGAS